MLQLWILLYLLTVYKDCFVLGNYVSVYFVMHYCYCNLQEKGLHLAVTMGLISLEPVLKKWVTSASPAGETDIFAVAYKLHSLQVKQVCIGVTSVQLYLYPVVLA